jgi:hypothetical protein
MYKVKCTGKNTNYGVKDEVRLIADHYLTTGLQRGWFTLIKYEGSAKPDTPYALKRRLDRINEQIKILEIQKAFTEDILRKVKK